MVFLCAYDPFLDPNERGLMPYKRLMKVKIFPHFLRYPYGRLNAVSGFRFLSR